MKMINKIVDANAHIENLICKMSIENGASVAMIGFDNLAYGTITAIKFDAQGYNSFDDTVLINGKEKFLLIIQDISVGKSEGARNLKVILPSPDIRKLELKESQICFSDGSVATYQGKKEVSFELEEFDTAVSAEREQLDALKDKFGDGFKYKPKECDAGWICGCGCLNKADSDVCISCGTNKADAFSACTEGSLKTIVEKYRVAEEEKKEVARKEAGKKAKEKKQQNIKIGIGVVVAVVVTILVGHSVVMSQRTTYSSEEEMKAAVRGTYTYYEDYQAQRMINISGNTVTEKWPSLDSSLDLPVSSWNPKNGTFKASFAHCIVTNTGDIIFDGDLYEKGGSWSSSSSSSYESGDSVLKITIDGVTNNSSYTVCTGSVKNTGEKTYKFVEVKGSFKDSSGNVIDTDSTYAAGAEGLAPGEASTFRMSVPKNNRISSCSVSLLDFD